MIEEWRDVRNFPGYQVSNLGRIRTHNKVTSSAKFKERHWKDRVLKEKVSKKDQCHRVSIWNETGEHCFLVHRLVADTFIAPLIDTDLTVNHKDGNRNNNNVENLEWMTRADNIRHGFETGLYKYQTACELIDEAGNSRRYRSLAYASKCIGRHGGYIREHIINGRPIIGADGKEYKLKETEAQK